MTTAAELRALADRVCAEEPSRELDADIAGVVGLPEWIALKYQKWLAGDDDTPALQYEFRRVYAPHYTTSRDDAAAMMPAGWFVTIREYSDLWRVFACSRSSAIDNTDAPTEPRARTAAALRVRAAVMEDGDG